MAQTTAQEASEKICISESKDADAGIKCYSRKGIILKDWMDSTGKSEANETYSGDDREELNETALVQEPCGTNLLECQM